MCQELKYNLVDYIEEKQLSFNDQTPYVTIENPPWKQDSNRQFGRMMGAVKKFAAAQQGCTVSAEWHPSYALYVQAEGGENPRLVASLVEGEAKIEGDACTALLKVEPAVLQDAWSKALVR